ncbi:unnamed protein product, partial [Nesidiocoris tenuis]
SASTLEQAAGGLESSVTCTNKLVQAPVPKSYWASISYHGSTCKYIGACSRSPRIQCHLH